MKQAVFAFRHYEDFSLSRTGIELRKEWRRYGPDEGVIAVEDATP
ncbi:hypothetical protein [Nocardiopsis sp. NPDC006832]